MGNYEVAKTVAQDKSIPHIEIKGNLIHSEAFGDPTNQAVIVLHGGPGNDFRHLLMLNELADDYYMIFYDQRGSGLSERIPAEKLTLEGNIQDLDAIIDHYSNGRKVNLIGHSWGGMLASGYMAQHPGKLDKVVMAEPGFLNAEMYDTFMENTNGFALEFSFTLLKHLTISWFESLHVDGPDDQAGSDYFMTQLVWGTEIENHPMAGYFCNGNLSNVEFPEWRFGSLASKVIPQSGLDEDGNSIIDLVSGVEQFQDTILFIAGDCNEYIGPDFQQKQMEYFNKTKMVVIKDAGHYMFGDQPEECIQIIRDYFNEGI
jgi:proline iminopeptidase